MPPGRQSMAAICVTQDGKARHSNTKLRDSLNRFRSSLAPARTSTDQIHFPHTRFELDCSGQPRLLYRSHLPFLYTSAGHSSRSFSSDQNSRLESPTLARLAAVWPWRGTPNFGRSKSNSPFTTTGSGLPRTLALTGATIFYLLLPAFTSALRLTPAFRRRATTFLQPSTLPPNSHYPHPTTFILRPRT